MTIPLYGFVVSESIVTTNLSRPPHYYKEDTFGFSQSQTFVKLNSLGHVQWEVSRNVQNSRCVGIQFDRIYLLTNQKELECLDSEYAYRLWAQIVGPVSTFKTHYPYLICLLETGAVICLDFRSGSQLWTSTAQNIHTIEILHKKQMLLAISKERVFLISLVNGVVEQKQWISFMPDIIHEDPFGNVLMNFDSKVFRYNVGTNFMESTLLPYEVLLE